MSTLDKFMRIFSIFADNVARINLVKVQNANMKEQFMKYKI